jgi:hypothetical protein
LQDGKRQMDEELATPITKKNWSAFKTGFLRTSGAH